MSRDTTDSTDYYVFVDGEVVKKFSSLKPSVAEYELQAKRNPHSNCALVCEKTVIQTHVIYERLTQPKAGRE